MKHGKIGLILAAITVMVIGLFAVSSVSIASAEEGTPSVTEPTLQQETDEEKRAKIAAENELAARGQEAFGTNCRLLPGDQCPKIYHYSPDDDYDSPIRVTCGWNAPAQNAQQVEEGTWDTCVDMDGVFVRADEEIWCKYYMGDAGGDTYLWARKYDAAGWHQVHYITWSGGVGCTVRRD